MSNMYSPGTHEDHALEDADDNPHTAAIRAQLAIAAALNRLAQAVENHRPGRG